MRIEKKTWPKPFQAIMDGIKTFDVRLADFDAKPGDVLILREFDPARGDYTGRVMEKPITFVINTKDQEFWTQDEIDQYGLQIFGFK
jgi:hypothetical protein